jgi:GH25 family lysozyme M1 (1,4-beta-N-acetylmuramidase)
VTAVEAGWDRQVLLYVGDDFEAKYRFQDHIDRSLWRQSFLRRPSGDDWALWQVSGFSRVAGPSGRVDLDVAGPCRLDPGPTCQLHITEDR